MRGRADHALPGRPQGAKFASAAGAGAEKSSDGERDRSPGAAPPGGGRDPAPRPSGGGRRELRVRRSAEARRTLRLVHLYHREAAHFSLRVIHLAPCARRLLETYTYRDVVQAAAVGVVEMFGGGVAPARAGALAQQRLREIRQGTPIEDRVDHAAQRMLLAGLLDEPGRPGYGRDPGPLEIGLGRRAWRRYAEEILVDDAITDEPGTTPGPPGH